MNKIGGTEIKPATGKEFLIIGDAGIAPTKAPKADSKGKLMTEIHFAVNYQNGVGMSTWVPDTAAVNPTNPNMKYIDDKLDGSGTGCGANDMLAMYDLSKSKGSLVWTKSTGTAGGASSTT